MKKTIVIIFFLLEVCIGTAFGQQWQQLHSDTIPQNLTSLYFTSPKAGFMVGCDPTQSSWSSNILYKTVDSGNTWSYAGGSEMCMPLTYFINSNTGYFITRGSAKNANNMKKTTDSGNTWTDLAIQFSNFDRKGIFFVDENTGYYGGGDGFYIYKTTDGGNTWTTHNTGGNSAIIDAIWFMDKDVGFIAGWYGAKIAKTTDGGETWADVSNNYSVYAMQFPSASVGYAVASDLSNKPVIIKTNDGGNTWNTVYTLATNVSNRPRYFSSLYCIDANTCYAVGDSGTIIKTIDAGNTWERQISGTTQKLNSIFCINNACYAAGDSSTLLKTHQGIGTGIQSHIEAAGGIVVFPNPVSNMLVLQFPHEVYVAEIKILNVVGETVLLQRTNNLSKITLDVAELPIGIYFLQVTSSNSFFIQKIVKQ